MNFAHLHVHTAYSLLDSMVRIDSLVAKVSDMDQNACAITDHGSLAGAVKFTDACRKKNIKPLIGQEFYMSIDSRHRHYYPLEVDPTDPKKKKTPLTATHLILLAKNDIGWRNISTLSTLAWSEGFYKKPRIDHELLARYSEGLIATTACMGGDCSVHLTRGLSDEEGDGKVQYDPGLTAAKIAWYVSIFGDDFYIELQEHGESSVQRSINDWYRERYPAEMFIASADCHYLNEDDYDTHDTLLCCNVAKHKEDPNRWRFPTDQAWLKTTEEMAELFYPHELENTQKIADKIEFELPLRKTVYMPELPKDVLGGKTPQAIFTQRCVEGLCERMGWDVDSFLDENEDEQYKERLDYEMGIFIKAGYCEYALVLYDLMAWAKNNDIFTGDGRGSGAGSLVLFALRITNVDPILRDCPFERFINPGRLENFAPPDVDLDFPQSRRGEVVEYLRERYGRDHVCQIGTYATLGAAGLIKKLAFPLGIPGEVAARLTATIPTGEASTAQGSGAASEAQGMSLDDIWQQSESFRNEIMKLGETGKWLLHYARGLRNLGSHSSKHASGIIITDRPVTELLPLMKGSNKDDAEMMAQFDMFDAEAMGLIKFDILGLGTLDAIKYTEKMIQQNDDIDFSFDQIDLDDPATYDLLSSGKTVGIFQAEGGGLGALIPRCKPRNIEDLAILNSLCRPGPMLSGDTATYVKRRQGQENVTYNIPELEPILENSLGVLAFQEQIMAIAHKLAGFSLAEADELRKVMGKKQIAKMPVYREKLINGLESHSGISPHEGGLLWDQLLPMSQYVFNKAHAVAYSYTTAKCAYAKAHYPAYFLAGTMTVEIESSGGGAQLPNLVRDAQGAGCKILAPDINKSERGYSALDRKTILLGLLAIRGVGPNAVDAILAGRAKGPFTSAEDFRVRIPARSANKTVLDALIRAGAFDEVEGRVDREQTPERLEEEFDLFGFYLSGHICAMMREEWNEEYFDLVPLIDIENDWKRVPGVKYFGKHKQKIMVYPDKHVRGIVSKFERKKSKKTGKFMLMIDVEDETYAFKMIINAGQLEKFGNPPIKKGSLLDMQAHKSDPERWAGYIEPTRLSVIK